MQIENHALPKRHEMTLARTRPLGETGIDVPWVGLCSRTIGYHGTGSLVDSVVNSVKNGVVPDADAVHLVKNALDCEANLIETAPTWGAGRAERLVGDAIRERRSRATLVLRVGRQSDGSADFSAAGLEAGLAASLRRMQTDYADVALLHNPGDEVLDGSHEAWSTLQKWRKEGKIRAFGAAVCCTSELEKALESTPAQVLHTRFNIFRQRPARLFDRIAEKRVGFLAGSPLDSGFLGGRYGRFSVFFDPRKRWSRRDVWRRGELRDKIEALRPAAVGLAQFALQFVLAHPAVSCAVAGARDQHQLIYNTDSVFAEIDPQHVEALRRLWLDELDNDALKA